MDKTVKNDTVNRKRGVPVGNRNALRHGLKAGKLPKGCSFIECRLNDFRRQLEDSVVSLKGEVTLTDAACIQSALRWERHACLAQRWLRIQSDELKPLDKLSFSREIARASSEGDKTLKQLGLDKIASESIIDVLYSRSRSDNEST